MGADLGADLGAVVIVFAFDGRVSCGSWLAFYMELLYESEHVLLTSCIVETLSWVLKRLFKAIKVLLEENRIQVLRCSKSNRNISNNSLQGLQNGGYKFFGSLEKVLLINLKRFKPPIYN